MATMAATTFQAHRARRQIQIIMNHQNLSRRNAVKTGQRCYRLTAAVHEGQRLKQPRIPPVRADPAQLAVKAGLGAKCPAVLAGQRIDQPESGVMTGVGILGAGITQPHQQSQRR